MSAVINITNLNIYKIGLIIRSIIKLFLYKNEFIYNAKQVNKIYFSLTDDYIVVKKLL